VRLGKDSSYGALDRISQAMGFDAEAATSTRQAGGEAADGALEGGLGALHPGLRGLEDGSALVACYVQESSGRVGLCMNAGFQGQLMTQAEALRELGGMQCLPVFLWGW
jgi:hypothetical protein